MRLKIILVLTLTNFMLFGCKQKESLAIKTTNYFEVVRSEFKGDVALETTAFVEKYWRVAGNTGFNKTVYHIVSKLETAGYIIEEKATVKDRFTYRIEKRALKNPTWEPVDASLSFADTGASILEHKTNRNMIFLNSFSTPKEGITGEILYIENKEALEKADFKGKIVFAEMSPFSLYKKAIVEGGAIGIITYNNPSYLQPEKNTTSIQFRSLPYNEKAKPWGIALSYAAKEKLKTAIAKGVVKVNVKIETKIYPSEELTVVANVKGESLANESLVFSAHIQEPGANDNATGVGTQLEMAMITANLIKAAKVNAKRTLTFLWGDEIISTRRYIQEKEKRTADINWGISLDMVGENTTVTGGSFLIEKMPDPSAIWTRGNDKHSEWGGDVLKLEDMKPHYLNDFIITVFKEQGVYANWEVNTNPFEGGSDHTPFLDADIPGLLLWHFTDQFYHTDNDRIDKVSKETMKNVGISALVSAYTLINADANTGSSLVKSIGKAAKVRLTTEFELSKKAIAGGAKLKEEKKIIKAWSDWYQKTLASLEDMNTDPAMIAEAQANLNMQMKEMLNNLATEK